MAITASQKASVEEVLKVLTTATAPRSKRRLCDMFMELPDKEAWPEYYDVIPQPRCLRGISTALQKNEHKNVQSVYEDLNLVFANAMWYNEEHSQIWNDAKTLKGMAENEWKQRGLPVPPLPPPMTAQKTQTQATPSTPAPAPAPTPTPAPTKAPTPAPAAPTPAPKALYRNSSVPIASTSKPVPILPRSPPRPSSPDMDVDIGGATPEPDGQEDSFRDELSDEIVGQLERGLPRWQGFNEHGWLAETVSLDYCVEVLIAVKNHKDVIGNRPSTSLEGVPEDWIIPHTPYTLPLSLKLIESRCRSKAYASAKAFDQEMEQLFLKGRRWFEPGSEKYGHILLLQRLYQALTSSTPPPGPPYVSTTNFASLRAGPGTARPLHSSDTEGVPGVTTFRVSTRDRSFVDELHYKGWTFRLADWLHLSNPDDPSRPIIGQIFKCYVAEESFRMKWGPPGLTVCWYYRPEQTWHPGHRQFWENEVFKTSHFADHPLEDIIEKAAVQFTARHIRGRPRPPFWHLGWPLYVCDSRYNDRERIFVKIKNWNSCVPEEVRKKSDFMPIYPFERMVFPRRFPSPFIKGKSVKAPGGIGEAIEKDHGEKVEGGGTGRKRAKKAATASVVDQTGPVKGLYVGSGAQSMTSGLTQLPPHLQAYQQMQQTRRTQIDQQRSGEDRSIVTAAGGWGALGANATAEKLPAETARHFDRDPETNEVLWFAGPPMNVARNHEPQYSLAYLHFLAKKRKAREEAGETDNERKKQKNQPSPVETAERLLTEFLQG